MTAGVREVEKSVHLICIFKIHEMHNIRNCIKQIRLLS